MAKAKNLKFIISFVFAVVVFTALPAIASAATLYFSPASGSYAVGKIFNVSVYVSSADQAMNAASGVISFPSDKLEVVSLVKSGSIFGLWVQDPSFSNASGAINFEGIVLNPGFTGSGGKIMTVNFRVKTAGSAAVSFSSGSILANDGAGTNILSGLGSANYQLSGAAPSPTTPTEPAAAPQPAAVAGVPAAPQIISTTHPEPNNWYSNNKPQFSWVLPAGVSGVGVYFSPSPTSNPGPVADGLFASKSYENVKDGVWYFHLKFKNSFGWSPISHFKIQIDTAPPEPFTIEFVSGEKSANPLPVVLFNTVDNLSGVDYYQVKFDTESHTQISANVAMASNPYTLPLQKPGKHTLFVQAFDKAGNHTDYIKNFEIIPLESPQILEYPATLRPDEFLTIKGRTYPDSQVTFWLQRERDEAQSQEVKSDKDGNFLALYREKLPAGVYQIWATVTDGRGAQSQPSQKLTLAVSPSQLIKIGSITITYLSVIIPLISLVVFLTLILWYSWFRFSALKKRLRKEVREAESALRQSFDLLKANIRKQVKMLEKIKTKRELTVEEEKIIRQFKKDLDEAERVVRKEIDDIEKVVKRS